MPLISIIIATFNRSHLIENMLACIKKQSQNDWECIIVDDGSTDRTPEILHKWQNKDSRFKYYKRKHNFKKGLSGSRNMGLDLAKGDYIIFFDDDDLVHPENLETCLCFLKRTGKDFCNYQKTPFYQREPSFQKIDKSEITVTDYTIKDLTGFITGAKPMASCTVMFKRKCFEDVRFNEELHYAEEWECYGRILLKGYQGISISEMLYFNRKHTASNTGNFNKGKEREVDSMIDASKVMIKNLYDYQALGVDLEKFFIRKGFQLKDYGIVNELFKYTNPGVLKKVKFKLGFYFYPVIKPLFRIKSRIAAS